LEHGKLLSESVSDCCFLQPFHGENKWHSMRRWCCLLCTRPTRLIDLYGVSWLKQQSMGRHVALLGHIFLIPNQPVLPLSPWCCLLSREATHIIFSVFELTRPWLEPAIYHMWGEHANYYTNGAVTTKLTLQIYWDIQYPEICKINFPFSNYLKVGTFTVTYFEKQINWLDKI
jgi:hypothetical protein